jgi:hypothetical protein
VQKLGDAGITSVVDLLKLEESEVANILKSYRYTTYKHMSMFFNMDIPHSQLVVGSNFLSCWIHVVIFFLLLMSCFVFYVFGITCMLGQVCLTALNLCEQ